MIGDDADAGVTILFALPVIVFGGHSGLAIVSPLACHLPWEPF